MFCFDFCLAAEVVSSKKTSLHSSELSEYEMRSLVQKNCEVLITMHQSLKAFSFISIGYLFIDLSSSTIENLCDVLR